MKKNFFILFALALCLTQTFRAQIPTNTLVQIVKAEDERRYDATLEKLLKNPDAKIRRRAALAAGRIGDERAIPAVVARLNDDPATTAMILFALGEIESAQASQTLIDYLKSPKPFNEANARAIEAAGKIAAANPKDAKTPELGKTIVSALNNELEKRSDQNRETVLFGITAILRARPEGGESVAAKFLDDSDARVRADALNTLARLRSKNVNEKARELLARDLDPIVRANAARMLGVGEDKSAIDLLLNAATKDVDPRVRVSAIRSLGSLKDTTVGKNLIDSYKTRLADFVAAKTICSAVRGEKLLTRTGKPVFCQPEIKSELLEIATALGIIFQNTNDQKAVIFLDLFRRADDYESPEIDIAFAKIAPENYLRDSDKFLRVNPKIKPTRHISQSLAAGLSEFAKLSDEKKSLREAAAVQILVVPDCSESLTGFVKFKKDKPLGDLNFPTTSYDEYLSKVLRYTLNPDEIDAIAEKTNSIIKRKLKESKEAAINLCKDAFSRATIAGLLSDLPVTKENIEALKSAFTKSLLTDKQENDAQLAILNALYKLDKKASVGTFLVALNAPDYLVRKRAFEILKDADLQKDFPGIPASLESFAAKKRNQVLPYAAYTGTKLGQIFYTNADYIRAVSRKNGTVKAVFATTKGNFTIDLFPEDAPLAVDNFIRLARAGYFNGVSVHRVVPNFVMQDGDPRGDGNGGPGWQIRCEINTLPYERGAIGMALSGKDTGGSQWFATHSPQPHLDGGYTVFGKINENDMKVVDSIVRGDKILTVKIVGETPQKVVKSKR